ncbi:MAG: excinuclease ABC subunit UvrA [Planctomycetota bacterium]
MSLEDIVIQGAREHNLKGVDLRLPRQSLTTITGVSGSGKSSLAFDTLFKEGQRRFVESLSAYARQFLGQMEKPRVEHVEGLSPTISIDQKTVNRNPRSTVGTITEVHDFLRLLYARLGDPHCPRCGKAVHAQTVDQIVGRLIDAHPGERCQVLAPVVRERKGEYRKELDGFRLKGYVRARIDAVECRLDQPVTLERNKKHTIEIVIDRMIIEAAKRSRLAEAVQAAVGMAEGVVGILLGEQRSPEHISTQRACPDCGLTFPEMEPRLFSFNSPQGACEQCNGLGVEKRVDPELLIADPKKSIRDGALRAMSKNGYLAYSRLGPESLQRVAEHFGFSLDQPWESLTRRQKDVLLHGSGDERVKLQFRYRSPAGMLVQGEDHKPIEGLVPSLEAAYRFSKSPHLERYLVMSLCAACQGTRLNAQALAVTFRGHTIAALSCSSVKDADRLFQELVLDARERPVGHEIVKEIRSRLRFLINVGLGYLKLDRGAATLSGGEAQRVRLATQVGSGLQGVLYVLDEPSIGLHQRDNQLLIATLKELRDVGNTVVVVEHDRDIMLASDHLVDVGPGAGSEGGEIVADGPVRAVVKHPRSLTARYLRGDEQIPVPARRRAGNGLTLTVEGARQFNLKNLTVRFPLGKLVGVTGVSGSGKSTLVDGILRRALAREFHNAQDPVGEHDRILGIDQLDKVIEIDQSPIGRTPRSNPATYTKVFDLVRDLFALAPEARVRGYTKSRFSFNVEGGRCESCKGSGVKEVEMQFLADVEIPCEECAGRRYNRETLEILYKGRSIHDVLQMPVAAALEFFAAVPRVREILQTLVDVGLGYIALGQSSTTLSGGEAQRVKLAAELSRPATGKTLYILDEPTTGLHFADIEKLLLALERLVDRGNSVIVIEHNMEVIKVCDHLIDLGPEGGDAGGYLVAEGTPEVLMASGASITGRLLRAYLQPPRIPGNGRATRRPAAPSRDLLVVGARKNNLKALTVTIPNDRLTVITGVSGSGKSSLAFDTLFAEGQRRFVESLSTYARRFVERMDKAPVDALDGLRPAIAIDQKGSGRSPRSIVATSTEIYDYLRLLFARVGHPHCVRCGREIIAYSPGRAARECSKKLAQARASIVAPLYQRGLSKELLLRDPHDLAKVRADLVKDGFVRVLIDGVERRLEDAALDDGEQYRRTKHVDLVIDRIVLRTEAEGRVVEAFEQAFRRGHGLAAAHTDQGTRLDFAMIPGCVRCDYFLLEELAPRMFSFNSLAGACADCEGLGEVERCDPDRLVARPDRPLLRGALVDYPGRYFAKPGSYFRSLIESAAAELGIDLRRPFHELKPGERRALLYGEGLQDEVAVAFRRDSGDKKRRYQLQARFGGIIPEIEKWTRNASEGTWWTDRLRALTVRTRCPTCGGGRLQRPYLAVTVAEKNIHDLTAMTVAQALAFFGGLELEHQEATIAEQILKEVKSRLQFLNDVGLHYVTLDRRSATLSGGESQRIRLATQLGNRLVGVLYVLDEPSIGLHPRDNARLIKTLEDLRDLGNTVVVVEHDRDMMRTADCIIDIGPGAGERGGELVAQGSVAEIERDDHSVTGAFLSGRRVIPVPEVRRQGNGGALVVRGARQNNLKGIDVAVPLGTLTVVTGVSGSGKSTLVMDVLRDSVARSLEGKKPRQDSVDRIDGLAAIGQLIVIDQEPIGITPASNAATYTKVFDSIRDVFAATSEARMRGFDKGRFSFNQPGGRCEACQGKGSILVEMHFLSDVWITCEVCGGQRYDRDTLSVTYRGKSIADVLAMEVSEATQFFQNYRRIHRILSVLDQVGLGYLRLGQSSTTLSGGEAQRVKLAAELSKTTGTATLYLLDEPTTGLHLADVEKLVRVLHDLVDRGNTVLVIEHHLDVIANADWVIDLGPEAGDEGGHVVVAGAPEAVATCHASHTGRFLKAMLRGAARTGAPVGAAAGDRARWSPADTTMPQSDNPLIVQGDRTILLEVGKPGYTEARDFLALFAELEKSPEHVHTYRLTPLSIWNAAAAGLTADAILAFLARMSRYDVPPNVVRDIRDNIRKFGLLKLTRRKEQLVLISDDGALLRDLAANRTLCSLFEETPDVERGLVVREGKRGEVKQALIRIGYPIEDLAGYLPGAPYEVALRTLRDGGEPFTLRSYQREAAEIFHAGGSEKGGSGVIVLPCGAGKTVVGLAAMAKLRTKTLILTTNTVAVRQWRAELLDKTDADPADIGEYTGESKSIRPITIATYQILTYRKRKTDPFVHFELFSADNWGLVIYDEVHLLPAPVFRVTADIQARRRLGLTATLVREDHKEDEVFSLIGPKKYDVPWKVLEKQGWIATAHCIELRVPLYDELRHGYLAAAARERFRMASENPAKREVVACLTARHHGDLVLVIGQYLDQLTALAAFLRAPLITGRTPTRERQDLYERFKRGDVPVLVVSKVGNFAIDLPDANVAIQISGTFGSRQEEAQRLGRILRPKKSGSQATFYSVVTQDSREEEFANKRQLFLTEQGYTYEIRGIGEMVDVGHRPQA